MRHTIGHIGLCSRLSLRRLQLNLEPVKLWTPSMALMFEDEVTSYRLAE